MHDQTFSVSRRTMLRAGAVLSLGLLASCGTPKITPSGNGSDQTDATLGYINDLRKQKGLKPLARDPAAAQAALSQASRMAKAGKMSHLIGIGDSFLARMKGDGVPLPAAENIAVGQDSAERAYAAWFNSPKHLENMLGPNYNGLGVAVMRNPASGNRPYWAMVLSTS
ncbi:secretion protein [Rhizobium sp. Root73]|uniref:CAP domain-containing protein n=1 Tax=unclassified Rhizobium TaxID=2613769 RepID=UPI000714496B|nr:MULTISPECIES: CAP domain-containing protein [unclassified Rhizobium]KQV42002.1 secretion protein [Rhizobium sp. Root1204]KQY17889.1 secretion protein [Rhizobium sp. Root1334]KRC13750.1 secretion protein [Rhizobium sp. Root73]